MDRYYCHQSGREKSQQANIRKELSGAWLDCNTTRKLQNDLQRTQSSPLEYLYIQDVVLQAVSSGQHNSIHQHNTRKASNFNFPSHPWSLSEWKPSFKDPVLQQATILLETTSTKRLQALTGWLQERPTRNMNYKIPYLFFVCCLLQVDLVKQKCYNWHYFCSLWSKTLRIKIKQEL